MLELQFDWQMGVLHFVVSILLADLVWNFLLVFMLYEKNKNSFVFFARHLAFVPLFGRLLCLEHIHEGALDDLNDSLVKFEGVFKFYL